MKRSYIRYKVGDIKGDLTLKERMPGGQKWKCTCKCGNETIIQVSNKQTKCRDCSYRQRAENRTTHGESGNRNRLYRIWSGMRTRCNNPKHHSYVEYGARGITVAKEWDSYENFKTWALDNNYRDELTLNRIDNMKEYSPTNCNWVTHKEQMRNTRHNHMVEIDGYVKCVAEWCNVIGVKKTNAYKRAKIKNITVDEYLQYRYEKVKPQLKGVEVNG
jgi:hypothetical protein